MLKTILAGALIALVAGCAATADPAAVARSAEDASITTRVKTRLASDPQVAATRIEVDTTNGTVQLSGVATSDTEKLRAAQIARSVPEVTGVRNDIVIRP